MLSLSKLNRNIRSENIQIKIKQQQLTHYFQKIASDVLVS